MKVRLYLDEDAMGNRLVRALRSNGLDLVTASEAGMSGQPDEEHLKHATSQDRALFSYNIYDYATLSTRFFEMGISHSGIILVEQRTFDVGEQSRRLARLVNTLTAEQVNDDDLTLEEGDTLVNRFSKVHLICQFSLQRAEPW